ncbi:MAG: DNA-directed RNA polymerase subunit L [Candidatus Bathyarchaeota archaeon]|nr:DNA-directed RNA polymerase subunit L [Candidatus Termiticorpusculum sp.]MCL1970182.1 DNA-directed RNA polymerase subunit L [Candidatus Termiticorpusculum sp.]
MKINVLNKTENELKIEIIGADHGICNLLQKKILLDENVDLAGYDVPHPLASNPIIYVRMKDNKSKPQDTLLTAAKKAIADNDDFTKALEKALKA